LCIKIASNPVLQPISRFLAVLITKNGIVKPKDQPVLLSRNTMQHMILRGLHPALLTL